MCVTEVYIDRYPNGAEVEFRQTRHCQYGRPGRPCQTHSTVRNTPRMIGYGEPTSEYMIRQPNTPPRSSTSSGRSSYIEVRDESPKPKKGRSGSLLLSAFFGVPPRRRTRRENVVVIDGPPSPLSPLSPRSPRSPRTPLTPQSPPPPPFSSHLSSSRLPRTPPPYVFDAAPRGRSPVIVDDRRQPERASSVEVHIGVRSSENRQRSRSRSPSSILSELHRKEEEEERERHRQRIEREAILASEVKMERERRRREERRALHDAEINARPAVPNPPLRRQSAMRPVVEQSNRLSGVINDMNLSARGERVIAAAIAERQREEREREREREREPVRERRVRVEIDEDEAEARRQRLRRRFTIARAPSRRHRVMYDDGTFRYE